MIRKAHAKLFAIWGSAVPLYRSACDPPAEAIKSWVAWRAKHDLQGLVQRFLPAIWKNLAGHPALRSDEVSMRSLHVDCWKRNMTLLEGGHSAITALDQAGVPTLVLKGAAMLIRYYDDPGLRSMSDFDLLVPYARRVEALQILQAAGWELAEPVGLPQLFAHHGCALLHPDNSGFKIDLHWCALSECRWEGADDDFWERAQPFAWRGIQTHLLAPSDAIVHLVCHAARMSAYTSPWLLDVSQIVKEHGEDVNWTQSIEAAVRFRVAPALEAGLHFLHQRLGWSVPVECLTHRVARVDKAYFWALGNQGRLLGGIVLFLTDFWRTRQPPLDGRLLYELWQYVSPLWAVASPREAWVELRRRWRRLAAR